jgi:hypothetical protein
VEERTELLGCGTSERLAQMLVWVFWINITVILIAATVVKYTNQRDNVYLSMIVVVEWKELNLMLDQYQHLHLYPEEKSW